MDPYLRIGIKAAKKSTHRVKHAAILTRSGKILNIGVNSNKTDPIFSKDPSLNRSNPPSKLVAKVHAEQICLKGISEKDLKGAEMYVLRMSKKKGLGNSKPCAMCMRLLVKAGLKRVHWTEDYGAWKSQKL